MQQGFRPVLPDCLYPSLKNLIDECWQDNADERPTFDGIVRRLGTEITAEINSKPEPAVWEKEEEDMYTEHTTKATERVSPYLLKEGVPKDDAHTGITLMEKKRISRPNKEDEINSQLQEDGKAHHSELDKLRLMLEAEKEKRAKSESALQLAQENLKVAAGSLNAKNWFGLDKRARLRFIDSIPSTQPPNADELSALSTALEFDSASTKWNIMGTMVRA